VHALVAAFAARDPYAWLRPGGALALASALGWGVGVGEREDVDPRRLDLARGCGHRPLREADRVTLRRVDWFREWVDHPLRDGYWSARTPAMPEDPPPALLVAGWGHAALGPQLADFAVLRERARAAGTPAPELLIGPWPDGEPRRRPFLPSGSGARGAVLRATLAFLARLHGEPARRAPVQVFVRGAGGWRESSDWPEPACEPTAFFLRGDGPANGRTGAGTLAHEAPGGDAASDAYRFDPCDPVPADAPGAECRWDVLCYTSESLSKPLVLAGPVRVALWAASSAALTDFTATLAALAADGTTQLLCQGVLRSAGDPGRVRRLELDLGATCVRLAPGERLRLTLSSSAFPRWDRPSHAGVEPGAAREEDCVPAQQTVFRDRERPSHVVLPVLRG
jgi:putative CocE/NonD family hydrolase